MAFLDQLVGEERRRYLQTGSQIYWLEEEFSYVIRVPCHPALQWLMQRVSHSGSEALYSFNTQLVAAKALAVTSRKNSRYPSFMFYICVHGV